MAAPIVSTDAAGELTRIDIPDSGTPITYVYDQYKNIKTITDHTGTTTFTYSTNGLYLLRINYSDGRYIKYTYDYTLGVKTTIDAGRVSGTTDLSDYYVAYVYNSFGLLDTVKNNAYATLNRYEYHTASGLLYREYHGNGTMTEYTYFNTAAIPQAFGVLKSKIEYKDTAKSAILSKSEYTYAASGQIASLVTTEGKLDYKYDKLGQIIEAKFVSSNTAKVDNQTIVYEYGVCGSRISVTTNGVKATYSVNSMNQYTDDGVHTYKYDADGNMTEKKEKATGKTWTYTWNAAGRLTKQTGPDGTYEYRYDALGNRTAMSVNGVWTEYLVDPSGLGNVLVEYTNGTKSVAYTYGYGLVSQIDTAGNAYYYGFDAIGSTTVLTRQNGTIANSYAYDPFGNSLLKETGNEPVKNAYQYVGQYGVQNNGSGQYFMRARNYDPKTGRFTSEDPIGLNAGDLNLYRYCGNDPVNAVDPSGEILLVGAGAGGIIGMGLGLIKYVVSSQLSGCEMTLGCAIGSAASGAVFGAIVGATGGFGVAGTRALGAGANALGSTLEQLIDHGNVNIAKVGFEAGLGALMTRGPSRFIGKRGLTGLGNAKLKNVLNPTKNTILGQNLWGTREDFVRDTLGATGICLYKEGLGQLGKIGLEILEAVAKGTVPQINSRDPNQIVGPAGYGAAGYIAVTATTALPYRIEFQNNPRATAPAQQVHFTMDLDDNLDPSTLQLNGFGFGTYRFALTTADLGKEIVQKVTAPLSRQQIEVVFIATLSGKTLNFTFRTRYAGSNTPVAVTDGFLNSGATGYVSYTIKVKPAKIVNGTQIRAVGTVQFDAKGELFKTNLKDPNNPNSGTDPNRESLITISNAALGTPKNMVATATSATSVRLTWASGDTLNRAASYRIELWDAAKSDYVLVTTTTNLSYTHYGRKANTEHLYRITALNTTMGISSESVLFASVVTPTTTLTVPKAPENFRSTAKTTTSVTLNWNTVSSIQSYTLQSSTNGSDWTDVSTSIASTAVSYLHSGLAVGTTYYYRLRAVNGAGASEATTMLTVATLAVAPTAPTGLTISIIDSNALLAYWTKSTSATGYKVEYSANGTTWTVVSPSTLSDTSFLHTGLNANTSYSYRVTATNSAGNSTVSSVVSGKTLAPIASPANLRSTSIGKTAIQMEWNKVSGAAQYVLQRKGPSDSDFVTIYTGAEAKFSDTNRVADTTYQYRVQAKTSTGGTSAVSTAVSVKTLATTALDVPMVTGATFSADKKSATVTWGNLGTNYRYQLYRNGYLLTTTGISANFWVDTTPAASNQYILVSYDVTKSGRNISIPFVLTSNNVLPEIASHTEANGKVTLNWDLSGFSNVSAVRVYRNGNLILNATSATKATDINPSSTRSNEYVLYVVYKEGNNNITTFSSTYAIPQTGISGASSLSLLDSIWSDFDFIDELDLVQSRFF